MLWRCEDVLGGLEDEEDVLMDEDESILYSREREVKIQPPTV
jgi:hypothetical protein